MQKKPSILRYRLLWFGGGKKRVHIHRYRAEMALGHPLPLGAQVHHADGSLSDVAPLVICPNQAYHDELHRKMRVRAAGGDPWFDKICCQCQTSKPKTMFYRIRSSSEQLQPLCKTCANANAANYKRIKRAALRNGRKPIRTEAISLKTESLGDAQ